MKGFIIFNSYLISTVYIFPRNFTRRPYESGYERQSWVKKDSVALVIFLLALNIQMIFCDFSNCNPSTLHPAQRVQLKQKQPISNTHVMAYILPINFDLFNDYHYQYKIHWYSLGFLSRNSISIFS